MRTFSPVCVGIAAAAIRTDRRARGRSPGGFATGRCASRRGRSSGGVAAGLAVVWCFVGTTWLADYSFDEIGVEGPSFTAPLGRTILYAMTSSAGGLSLSVGVVMGVMAGAFIGSTIRNRFRWEACEDPRELGRQVSGAAMMGIGGTLALGCSIGQGRDRDVHTRLFRPDHPRGNPARRVVRAPATHPGLPARLTRLPASGIGPVRTGLENRRNSTAASDHRASRQFVVYRARLFQQLAAEAVADIPVRPGPEILAIVGGAGPNA